MALSEYARAGSGVRLLGVLLGLLMLVAGLPVASSHAEEPTEVLVELTSLAPATLSGSGELVISGRVTNQADQPLSQLTAHLWRDATPITTLSSLNAAEADPQASGEVMQSSDAVASLGDDGTLAPGASADFTVRADLGSDAAEQSWLSQPDAVYQVGVQVFSGPRELGGSSALVGYPGSTQADVGTIVLLNARPSLLPLESDAAQLPVFADGSLKADLETRLSQLLALAEQDNVLIVIDPQLYDEVTQLALPHAIRLADGSHSEATSAGSAVAQDWLNRLDALMTSGRIVRGLYGSVDVTQAVASGQEAVIKQAAELPSGHVLAALPLAVVPFSGQVDQQTVTALQSVSPRYIVASNLGDRLRYDAFGLQLLSVDASSAAQPAGNPIQARGARSRAPAHCRQPGAALDSAGHHTVASRSCGGRLFVAPPAFHRRSAGVNDLGRIPQLARDQPECQRDPGPGEFTHRRTPGGLEPARGAAVRGSRSHRSRAADGLVDRLRARHRRSNALA